MSICASATSRVSFTRPAAVGRTSSLQVIAMAVGARHKGALHHAKSRPIKYTPADKRHVGATYPAMPPPPPEYVIVSAASAKAAQ